MVVDLIFAALRQKLLVCRHAAHPCPPVRLGSTAEKLGLEPSTKSLTMESVTRVRFELTWPHFYDSEPCPLYEPL